MNSEGTVTRLLRDLRGGDREAFDVLFPLVYKELRLQASKMRGRWQGDNTMDTSALVHEVYLKLVDQDHVQAENRTHFLALAARAMRHILCNYARDRGAVKRGGHVNKVPIDVEVRDPGDGLTHVLDRLERLEILDRALTRLEAVDERRARIVECRFFGGMSTGETAAALGISERTVRRDWTVAQAWLQREMKRARF